MNFGFNCFGDASNLQATSEAKGLFLSGKGTFSTSSNSLPGPLSTRRSTLSIPAGVQPLLACRPRGAGDFMSVVYRTGGGGVLNHAIFSNRDIVIDYWIFDIIQVQPADTWGGAIWDPTGARAWHSGLPMMIGVTAGGVLSVTEPVGSTYAIVQGALSGTRSWISDPAHGPESTFYLERRSWRGARNDTGGLSGATLTTNGGTLDGTTVGQSFSSRPANINYGPAKFAVVDVTNL